MEREFQGVIRSFDGADGLGWIELEDGREVRFGMTACKKFDPAPGKRVRVLRLQESRGRERAAEVRAVRVALLQRISKYFGRRPTRVRRLDRFDSSDPRGDLGSPAGLLIKWCALNDLLKNTAPSLPNDWSNNQHTAEDRRRWSDSQREFIVRLKTGQATGRDYISENFTDKLSSDALTDRGLRFWLDYYGRWAMNPRSKFVKDLMTAAGVSPDGIFTIKEGTPIEARIFEQISASFAEWSSK